MDRPGGAVGIRLLACRMAAAQGQPAVSAGVKNRRHGRSPVKISTAHRCCPGRCPGGDRVSGRESIHTAHWPTIHGAGSGRLLSGPPGQGAYSVWIESQIRTNQQERAWSNLLAVQPLLGLAPIAGVGQIGQSPLDHRCPQIDFRYASHVFLHACPGWHTAANCLCCMILLQTPCRDAAARCVWGASSRPALS